MLGCIRLISQLIPLELIWTTILSFFIWSFNEISIAGYIIYFPCFIIFSLIAVFYYYLIIINITLVNFQCYILYSESYFNKAIDMIFTVLQLISVWKKVPLNSLLYYLPLTAGYSITIVSIKIFITVSMMIGNIIDIYLLGIMMILLNYVMYSGYFGLIIISYLLYLFLTKMEVFLIMVRLIDSFLIDSFNLFN